MTVRTRTKVIMTLSYLRHPLFSFSLTLPRVGENRLPTRTHVRRSETLNDSPPGESRVEYARFLERQVG
jgi:hypothetical protein